VQRSGIGDKEAAGIKPIKTLMAKGLSEAFERIIPTWNKV
jgi:hypothetical protein